MPTYPFQAQFDNPLPTAHDGLHERMAKIEARALRLESDDLGDVSSFNGRTGSVSFVLGDLTPLGDVRYLQLANFNTVGDARYVQKTGDTMTGTLALQFTQQQTSGSQRFLTLLPTISPPAGSSNFRVLNVEYAINASGAQTGSVSGLAILATETALNGFSHVPFQVVIGGNTRLRMVSNGNFGIGDSINVLDFGTTSAASFVIRNSTAPTADPSVNSLQLWSAAGEFQYRTPVASEGSGQTNRVHNRASQVTGSGTDYTLTNATARVDFGTTDAEIVLPTAGTYMVQAHVSILGTTDADEVRSKLRNSTDASDVGAEKIATIPNTNGRVNFVLMEIVTVTATKTIQIFAHNATAARGTVESIRTNIKYVRLS